MKKPISLLVVAVVAALLVSSIIAKAWQGEESPVVSDEVIESHLIGDYSTPQPEYLHIITGPELETINAVEKGDEATQTAGAALKSGDETPPANATPEPTPPPVPKLATAHDIDLIARTIWGEAEGVRSRAEQAAVGWCILNRVDSSGDSIESVVLAPHQFYCRTWDDTVPSYFTELAEDVVHRWEREHAGYTDVGRTLPAGYLFFVGDGERNHFTIEWQGTNYWDWSLPDPYIN